MKKFKNVSAIVLSFLLLTSAVVFGATITKSIQVTYRNISILVNGKEVPSEQEPFIYQGRTYIPLRTIGEAVNKKVDWDNVKNQVVISDPVSNFTRLGSFYELLNYFPDHYQYTKTEAKLTSDEITKIEKFLKIIDKDQTYLRLDLVQHPERSFLLKNQSEELVVFALNTGICIRYGNGTLYYMTPKMYSSIICGSSDGWIERIEHNTDQQTDEELYYLSYLTKINHSLFKNTPNRTKQITDLYSISLWTDNLE